MPWEKQFDKQAALDKALQAFWSRGYEATSMQELVDCTGVNRGSLSYCLIQTCSRTRVLLPHENVPEPAIPIRLLFQSVQDGHCRAEPPQSA
ncbi:MAG: TetR/AcrR family transcriptional regulator, partial [Alphaproteobacteria bacterium]|nr:TetR/AcrR family transcriptional regulator [Alphaproteobacteria bacterium]